MFYLQQYAFLNPHTESILSKSGNSNNIFSVSAFFSAMMAAFWAYEGWNNVGYLGGEIKNPKRNIPIALSLGTLIVIVLYLTVNAAFFNVGDTTFFENINSQTQQYKLKSGLDISMAIGSTALFSTSYFLQKKVEPLPVASIVQLKRTDINGFDRIATYQWNNNSARISDGLFIGSILMQSYFYFNKQTRPETFKIGTVVFQSYMLSQGIANTLKLALRNRPYMYNDKVPMEERQKPDARMSFFSAHTTAVSSLCYSFAFAHQTYLPDSKANTAIWISAITVPAIEGFLRVHAGKHYPSDVITGYLVGLGSSFLMHRLHLVQK